MTDVSDTSGPQEPITPIDMSEVEDIVDDVQESTQWGGEEPPTTPDEVDPLDPPISDEVIEENPTFGKPGGDDLLPEEDEDDPGEVEEKETDDDDSEFFQGVVGILQGKDLFKSMEKEGIKSAEDFSNAIEKEVASRLDAKQQEILEYMGEGVDVTKLNKLNQGLTTLHSITPEVLEANPNVARDLILGDFIERGFSREDADKYYGLIEKGGATQEEAAKALTRRVATFSTAIEDVKKEAVTKREQAESTAKGQLVALEKALDATSILDRTVGTATRAKMKAMVSTPVGEGPNGTPINALMKYKLDNPIDFEQKLTYLFTVTNQFKDLKSFDRSAETRVSKRLKGVVKTLSSSGGPMGAASANNKDTVTINMDTIDDIV